MRDPERFEIPHGEHTLIGDTIGRDLPSGILMLHGAGGAHRGKLTPLRRELEDRGLGSVAFDFVGHGETGGDLSGSSLRDRTEQALAVIDGLGLEDPLKVLAASMSGHTAVQLTRFRRIEAMALVVPAMYSSRAYEVEFGPDFSKIIRAPDSWRDSDGWEILGRYEGRLLVVAGGDDRVIPPEVVRMYHDSARRASGRVLRVVEGYGHMLFTEMRDRGDEGLKTILEVLVDTFGLV